MESPTFFPGPQIIYESLLYKTPPLDKLFVNWKKRWCVLLRKNPFDPFSVEFVYYADPMKQEQKGRVDLRRVVCIHPTLPKSKEHAFAVETKEHKFLLKAADANTKNIWVAKLCEFSGQDQSFHVTVPHQPTAAFAEATLKLATPGKVAVVAPTSGNPILEVPFNRIRRMGYQVVYDTDILWFETCHCKHSKEEFYFFVVASGMEISCQIIQEYKLKVENATGAFLILEKAENAELTYVSRAHYGHNEFPLSLRSRILQSGLGSLSYSWPMGTSTSYNRSRRQSEIATANLMTAVNAQGRRHTVQPLLGAKSPSPVPHGYSSTSPKVTPSPSPTLSPNHGKMTLDQISSHRKAPGSRSDSFDSGVKLDEFDVSRHSAPCYISVNQSSPVSKSSSKLQKGGKVSMSFDSPTTAPPIPERRISLDQFKEIRGEHRSPKRGGQGSRSFPSKDSTLGTSADMIVEEDFGHHSAYDRLEGAPINDRHGRNFPAVPPRSLESLAARYNAQMKL